MSAVEVDQLTTAELFELYSVKKLAEALAEQELPEPEWPQLAALDRPEMAEAMASVIDRWTALGPPPPVTPEVQAVVARALEPNAAAPTLGDIDLTELRRVAGWLRSHVVEAGRSPAAAVAGLLDLADEAGLDAGAAAAALAAGLGGA